MKTFFNVEDLGNLKAALAEAQEVKANRFGYQECGRTKTSDEKCSSYKFNYWKTGGTANRSVFRHLVLDIYGG